MASYSFTLGCCIFVTVAATVASVAGAASIYKVGDAEGWRLPDLHNPAMYANWADNYVFHVGDSMVFEFKNDSVARVSKTGYYHCNETLGGPPPKDGSTVFVLDEPGFYYFVSGHSEHCKRGQRLMIEAIGRGTSPSPSFTAGPSPSPSPSPSPVSSSAASWRIASVADLARFSALVMMACRWWCMP